MPFLSWFSRMGGKTYLRKKLYSMFPTDFDIYVEPFFGAGRLFFTRPKPDCRRCEVINDLDKDIYNHFKDIQKVSVEDIEKMNFRPSKKRFEALKQMKPPTNPVDRLYRFLYLNWNSFGGKGSTYANKARYTKKASLIKKLPLIQERLKGVVLKNKDYKTILRDYDSPSTFFYLDPPYYNVDVSAYTHKYIDFEELFDILKHLEGKFMLSINDDPYIRRLFSSSFRIKEVPVMYGIGSENIKSSELVITNY